MSISVIISTYNQPEWLWKTLLGYSVQTFNDFEILIADDGSSEKTARTIKHFSSNFPKIRLQHLWHEDLGYRRQIILNAALRACKSSYLVITDGDCIPRRDFLHYHNSEKRVGSFLSGGYCKLSMKLSRSISEQQILDGSAFSSQYLIPRGMFKISNLLKVSAPKEVSSFLDFITPTKATWNNCNSSGWLEDILAVNGFNEEMQYGGADRELGERLVNYGIKPKQVRNRAVCLHLDHKRGYKNITEIRKNQHIRKAIERDKSFWCTTGILKSRKPNS